MLDGDSFYDKAFSRNLGLISKQEQEQLRNSRVAIPGMGGMGGVHAATLARTGIGRFTIADFDAFDVHNINRQFGAFESTVGMDKAQVMRKMILDINPSADVTLINEAVGHNNLEAFLDGVDVVVDALDVFAIQARRLIFNRAREMGIPVISVGPVGFSAVSFVFSPTGMGFDEFTGVQDGMSEKEMAMRFIAAIAAQGPHLKYMKLGGVDAGTGAAPSVGIACQIGAGVAALEIVCMLLGRRAPKYVPWITQFDPYARTYKSRYRRGGAKNLMHRLRLKVLQRMMPAMRS